MTVGRALGLVAAGAVLAAAGFWLFHRDPTAQIKRRFEALAALVSKENAENAVQMAVRAQQLQDFFTNPAELRTPVYGLGGSLAPTDIASQTMAARVVFTTLTLRFPDCKVVLKDRDHAQATVTVHLVGTATTAEHWEEIRELQCDLQRVDGTWRFAACTVVDVVQK